MEILKSSEYPDCLCGVNNYRRYTYDTPQKHFSVLVCRACTLGRTWPPPLADTNVEAHYEARDDYKERFDNLALRQYFCNRILDCIIPYHQVGKLVDVGCNLGVFVKEAQRRGFEAEGVDFSLEAVNYGKEQLGLGNSVHHGSLADQLYPDASFDVISYLHCFEHLLEPIEELGEVKRVLRSSGSLVIEVPRFMSAWRVFLGYRWYGFSPFEHIWQLSKRGIEGILEREGFEIIKAKTRMSLYHAITPDFKGLIKLFLHVFAWLTATGDNLVVIARKKN